MSVILVTGAKGQLGNELQLLAPAYPQFSFYFTDIEELSITDEAAVDAEFEKWKPEFCINCAAYTAVDNAEENGDLCRLINATAVGYLAKACQKHGAKLVHISTDYVFDGTKKHAYTEDDSTNPQSVYGSTKLEGEELAIKHESEALVIRTSWVYSSFGNNFVKTMMRLMSERDVLNVVSDQVGSPTYARDLADVILKIIANYRLCGVWYPGIYHFSNEADISWYDFATTIKEMTGNSCAVNPIPTTAYPTPAKRPMFSLMDKSKFVTTFNIPLRPWKESLKACIALLQEQ
ncbi:MAG: dTDP-4-dehydrorhamnose reductase [Bacteroidota bacterium]